MSEKSRIHQTNQAARVLVIGRDAVTLALVVEEVRAAGIEAKGMTLAEADGTLTGSFDLVAFGGGVSHDQRQSLEQEARFHNPDARFIRVYAPYAASQIVAAARQAGPSVDLAAYCRRISYSGPLEPTLDVLRALIELHPAAIPFEAIDVLLDRRVDISPAAVQAKLIDRHRGGYCYEQNGLFARVLSAIGFEVEGLAAHVRWMAEPGVPPLPLTHRALRITIDGIAWLADVGFGSCVPTAPLRMDSIEPQMTQHESFRIVPMGPQFLLQALIEDEWKPVYSISSEPWLDGHYELANWYSSTHPSSHFRHRLIVTRTTPDARYVLAEGRLTIRQPDGSVEKRFLNADQIMTALSDTFMLPVEPEWRPIAEQAARAVETQRVAEAA